MPTVPEEEHIETPEPTTTVSPQPEPSATPTSAAKASHSRAASFSANRDIKHTLRRPSISSAELLRSGGAARSPNPLSPGETAPDIYRKQAQTISELTEANERLEAEVRALRAQSEKLTIEAANKEEIVDELEELKTLVQDYQRKIESTEKEREDYKGDLEKLVGSTHYFIHAQKSIDMYLLEFRTRNSQTPSFPPQFPSIL